MITRRESMLLVASALAVSTAPAVGAATDIPGPVPAKSDIPNPVPADWVDPLFAQPFIDTDEWRDTPVRHRYVHGGFKGTDALFAMYFPPKEQYEGRFFQPVAATSGSELGSQRSAGPGGNIGFAITSGGYLVESNLGSNNMYPLDDHRIEGYRCSAAVAQYGRKLAMEMYGGKRPYGYAWGGSGGGFKTMSMAENTKGIWDGIVPFIIGSPMVLPNTFVVQALAVRLLKDKWQSVVDAVDPGGSGDMFAGLNKEEADALREVTRFGFVPRSWAFYHQLGMGALPVLIDNMVEWDPTYFEDFWKLPGYVGANPPESLKAARVQHKTKEVKIIMPDEAEKLGLPLARLGGKTPVPVAFQMESLPNGVRDPVHGREYLLGSTLFFKSGAGSGQKFAVSGIVGELVTFGIGQDAFKVVNDIKVGDEVLIDNSIYLAAQYYQRHQVPPKDWGFYVFDQYRGAGGEPLYPQRPLLLGPKYNESGAGSIQTGRPNCKMIVVNTLMDEMALPWNADWYRNKVKEAKGPKYDDSFRLWFFDHSLHGGVSKGPQATRVTNYTGVLQQALRDVAAWAEKGTPPPVGTVYKMNDGQVEVPAKAHERKGVQPVVTLTANGGARADVAVGTPVEFTGVVEVPPGSGKVVDAEWDFEGSGEFPIKGQISADESGERATVKTTYRFSKAGTYFAVLRAASQRKPDGSPYARALNIARARVVVKA